MGTAATFDYTRISAAAVSVLRDAFDQVAVETEQGLGGRVHIKIVSPELNGKSEKAKQEMVWSLLREALGPDSQAISFILPYGMDELP